MTEKQQQAAAALFAKEWEGRGYEKGESDCVARLFEMYKTLTQ